MLTQFNPRLVVSIISVVGIMVGVSLAGVKGLLAMQDWVEKTATNQAIVFVGERLGRMESKQDEMLQRLDRMERRINGSR